MIKWGCFLLFATFTLIAPLTGYAGSCDTASIQAIAPSGTTIASAVETQAGRTNYCDIVATTTATGAGGDVINLQIGLPDASSWNSGFLFTGNGGFAGGIALDVADLQTFGYAVAATDTGHQGEGTDASWALNNPQAVRDFDFSAIHKTTVIAETIVSGYYGNSTYNSFFAGCSTGGRQGLVEAQKYPSDYDGIVAGDPAMGDPFIGFNWNFQALLQSPDTYLDPDAIKLVDQTVTSECDGLDGVVDGLIQNPAACTFDPSSLLCPSGQTSGCLTAGQVATLKAIYGGAVDTHGNSLYPGYSVSNPAESDPTDAGWGVWLTGCKSLIPSGLCDLPNFNPTISEPWSSQSPPQLSPTQWLFMDGFLQNFVFNDPNYNPRTFSFSDQSSIDRVEDATARWGSDAMDADLTSFTSQGHKLLMYHGWSDPALTPYVSVNYYNSALAIVGSTMPDNVRLFMVPGMHHCQGGPGPNFFDTVTPLAQWVENGIAPDGIIATHFLNNDPKQAVQRTMPLCSYPEMAQYNGVGPVDDASSWSCPTSGAKGATLRHTGRRASGARESASQ